GNVRVPGGESLAEAQVRGSQVVETIRQAHEADATVVAVSHTMLLHTVICGILNIPLSEWRRFELALASLTTIDFRPNNRTIVSGLNETCHLDGVTSNK